MLVKSENMNKVFFDVREAPVQVEGKIVPLRKAIMKVNPEEGIDDEVLAITSNRYAPVSNNKVLDMFGEIANKAGVTWVPGDGHLLKRGAKTIMEIEFPNNKVVIGENDDLTLKGWLTNSFDGKGSAKLELGFMRLVCTNGMIIGTKDLAISYRHVGDIEDKIAAQFGDYLHEKVAAAESHINHLNDRYFSTDQVHNILEEASWMGTRVQDALKAEWINQGKTLNAWLLYNVFTWIITHHVKANIETKMKRHHRLNKEVANWGA
ncbi:MAG: DUF932 domain-containing protein [Deltaproteobacteria bacterium]|nr:DUF932 domain-containing protein [Deltaproteobacteria bacterium]